MKSRNLSHEPFPPFRQARRLIENVCELAQTTSRATNERLIFHAQRVLEHAAGAAIQRTNPARSQALQYCHVAMAKLAAMVVAASCARLISDEQAADTREEMLVLEDLISVARSSSSPPATDGAATAEPLVASQAFVASDGSLSSDELAELRELVERDSYTKPASREPRVSGLEPES